MYGRRKFNYAKRGVVQYMRRYKEKAQRGIPERKSSQRVGLEPPRTVAYHFAEAGSDADLP